MLIEFQDAALAFSALGGGVLLVVGCAEIIRRRQLHAMRSFFEDAMDASYSGKIIFDEKERFVHANEKAYALFPVLRASDVTPHTLKKFLDYMYDNALEEDGLGMHGVLSRMNFNSGAIGFRELIMSEDGRLCLVEMLKTPCQRTVLVVSDVSDMKAQEDHVLRLRRSNAELFQAIEAATNGLMVTRKTASGGHCLEFANRAFCEIFGIDRAEARGLGVMDVFSGLEEARTQEEIACLMKMNMPGEIEFRMVGAEGEVRWYALRLTPVPDGTAPGSVFVGVLSDLTELRQREAEAFKGQKLEALGQLAAGVAHDFNNILSIVDGYSRMAHNTLPEEHRARDHIERIRVASQRGADLIKQMLTFSRHKIVEDSVVDLAQVVREQQTLLVPLLDASIHLDVEIEGEDLFVECPADNIVQIVMNLAVNARDAMPSGGSLRIGVQEILARDVPAALQEKTQGQRFACLCVEDTGIGMSPEVQARIFDPFYTTKGQGKGTGLGLSMVYGLARQMGGHVEVRSSPGAGTEMMVYFPLTDKEPSRVIRGNVSDLSSLRLNGFTALVAEDEPDLLLLVSDMLEKLGMRVIRASNGNQALLLQEECDGEIDILLTDVVMPGMNGVDLAELMGALRPEMKTIYMSGYPATGQMSRVPIPEDSCFMAKPVKYDELAHMIYNRLREGAPVTGGARWASGEGLGGRRGGGA